MEVSLFILYLLFPLSLFLGIKRTRGGKTVLLNKDESNFLRGAASLMVVFAHYCLRLEEEGLMNSLVYPFRFLGPLGVAFFFFLSGYGLYASNGIENIRRSFLKKRILSVYLPYLFIRIGTLLYKDILIADIAGPWDILQYILGFTIHTSWFVVVIMVLYIFYYAISFLQINAIYKIYILFTLTGCFSVVLFMFKGYEASYWYGNNLIFPLGVLCAYYQDFFVRILTEYKKLLLCVSLLLFMLMTGLYFVCDGILLVCVKMLAGISLVAVVLIMFHYVDFCSFIMQFLGKYSLYIYLTHTDVYRILNHYVDMSSQGSVAIYFVLVLAVPVMCKTIFDCGILCFKRMRRLH